MGFFLFFFRCFLVRSPPFEEKDNCFFSGKKTLIFFIFATSLLLLFFFLFFLDRHFRRRGKNNEKMPVRIRLARFGRKVRSFCLFFSLSNLCSIRMPRAFLFFSRFLSSSDDSLAIKQFSLSFFSNQNHFFAEPPVLPNLRGGLACSSRWQAHRSRRALRPDSR